MAQALGATARQYRPLPRVLRGFWMGCALLFALMFLVGYGRYRAGAPPAHYNPLGTVHFSDLMEYVPTYRLLHTAAFFHNPVTNPVAYPPFGAIFYQLLYATGHPVRAYVACAVLWLLALSAAGTQWLTREGLAPRTALLFPLTTLMMIFPFFGMVCYGNIELFLWMFTATGMWAWTRRHPHTAAALWGCAAAMKLYPILFLLLPLTARRFRAVLVGTATFVTVSAISLWYLGPSMAVAWRGSLHNVFGYQDKRVGEWTLHELATNHSAYNWVKLALRMADLPFQAGTRVYLVGSAALFLLLFFGRVRRLPVANQLLAITAFMLLFPPISYFHTLVHLLAPLALLFAVALRAERTGMQAPGVGGSVALMVPLFGSFMLLTEPRLFLFGGLLQALLLLLLFYNAVRFPFTLVATESSTVRGTTPDEPRPAHATRWPAEARL